MMTINIRDIPQSTLDNIKAEADRLGLSRQELLANLLAKTFGVPPMVWGYIKFDRPGDFGTWSGDVVDPESSEYLCPLCHNPALSWWLQVASNGELFRMCQSCASSE